MSTALAPVSARLLIQTLLARGVDVFFGTERQACEVSEAVRLTREARWFECRDEAHAAVAAALYQRGCGRLPVLVAGSRAGAINALANVVSASLHNTPLLIVVTDVDSSGDLPAAHAPLSRRLDTESIYAPVVRARIRTVGTTSVIAQVSAAIEAATSSLKPGPVLITVSENSAKRVTPVSDVSIDVSGARQMGFSRLLAEIQAIVDASARFVVDLDDERMSVLRSATSSSDRIYMPSDRERSMSTVAGAIGLSIADPSRQVVCFVDEKELRDAGTEVLVAVRECLSILFVVSNQSSHRAGATHVSYSFSSQEQVHGMSVDAVMWARSFGLPALAVSSFDSWTSEKIKLLLAGAGPVLIDARFENAAHAPSAELRWESIDNKKAPPLTRRQIDVLACVADGQSNKIIAARLGLTEATVKAHLTAVFKALKVSSRMQAMIVARQLGLICSS